jgi:RNA-binding protein
MIAAICSASGAELVQRVGHVALLYRRHPEKPRIKLD